MNGFGTYGPSEMSRPRNLITLKEIRCLACYDFGEVIDKFDHSKRARCDCRPARPNRWLCPCLAEEDRDKVRRDLKIIFEKHQN